MTSLIKFEGSALRIDKYGNLVILLNSESKAKLQRVAALHNGSSPLWKNQVKVNVNKATLYGIRRQLITDAKLLVGVYCYVSAKVNVYSFIKNVEAREGWNLIANIIMAKTYDGKSQDVRDVAETEDTCDLPSQDRLDANLQDLHDGKSQDASDVKQAPRDIDDILHDMCDDIGDS